MISVPMVILQTAQHYLPHCKNYNNVKAQSLSALSVAVNIDIVLKGAQWLMAPPTETSRQYRNA